jgi:hypothetical protein
MVSAYVQESPRQRELRERRAQRIVRANRVERLGLDACRLCGGASPDVAIEDVSLYCDCVAKVAALQRRANRLAQEHVHQPELVDPRDRPLIDIIAP